MKTLKAFLLSFLSPCGRIAVGSFWKRQFLLALLLAPCVYGYNWLELWMYDYDAEWAESLCLVPESLAHASLPCVAASFLGKGTAHFLFWCDYGERSIDGTEPPGMEWMTGLAAIACYLAALLIVWCSLALILRRLRATRFGFKLLPLCLPSLFCLPLEPCFEPGTFSGTLYTICIILPAIVCCLPSRPPISLHRS